MEIDFIGNSFKAMTLLGNWQNPSNMAFWLSVNVGPRLEGFGVVLSKTESQSARETQGQGDC